MPFITYHCVLWMPTLIHKEFDKPLNFNAQSDIFEISDSLPKAKLKDDSLIWAQLSLSESKDIEIKIFENAKGSNCIENQTTQLKYISHSQNGLFHYKTTVSEENILFQQENNKINFPCDIYHKIKEFYHNHDYHHKGNGDGILKPFIKNAEELPNLNIKEKDNPAIFHYFHEYHAKFLHQYNTINRLFSSIKNKRCSEFWFFLKFFKKNNYKSFFNLVSTVKGDKIYYNTLHQSCYNISYHINTKEIESENVNDDTKNRRRIIFNIENIIRAVTNFEDTLINKFTLSTSKISFWIAIMAFFLSIIISYCISKYYSNPYY